MSWAPQEVIEDNLSPKKKGKRQGSIFMQQSEQDNEENEELLQKKEQVDPEEVKQKQDKQLHKVEQDILKSEIDNLVQDMIKKSEGKMSSEAGSAQNKSQISSLSQKKGDSNQQGKGAQKRKA